MQIPNIIRQTAGFICDRLQVSSELLIPVQSKGVVDFERGSIICLLANEGEARDGKLGLYRSDFDDFDDEPLQASEGDWLRFSASSFEV